MNQELLIEAIDIIIGALLGEGDFCGSTEGRRLTELRWQLTGKTHNRVPTKRSEQRPLVTRPISLPIDLDNAVGVVAEKSGVSRNDLIEGALEAIIAERRLV